MAVPEAPLATVLPWSANTCGMFCSRFSTLRTPSILMSSALMTAMGLVAYAGGLNGRRHFLSNFTFAFLIALVLVIILDIDSPRVGFVKASQDSLIRLNDSLAPGPD